MSDAPARKGNQISLYCPVDREAVWKAAKRAANELGVSYSEYVLSVLSDAIQPEVRPAKKAAKAQPKPTAAEPAPKRARARKADVVVEPVVPPVKRGRPAKAAVAPEPAVPAVKRARKAVVSK